MKTPKRTYTTCFLEWGDEFSGRLSSGQQRAYARWKRKNRVKQLKRSLQRYKHGTMLPKLEALRSAYTQLQYLRKPKTTEDWTKWDFYLSQLKVLQDNIQRAIIDASMYYGEALYKSEHRKEQE